MIGTFELLTDSDASYCFRQTYTPRMGSPMAGGQQLTGRPKKFPRHTDPGEATVLGARGGVAAAEWPGVRSCL
jgi:hypothetical protein